MPPTRRRPARSPASRACRSRRRACTSPAASPEIDLTGVPPPATAEGAVSVSTAGAGPSLSPFGIGTTGLIVEATDIGLHLNAADPPPAGAQSGFKGVSIEKASLHLTGSLA